MCFQFPRAPKVTVLATRVSDADSDADSNADVDSDSHAKTTKRRMRDEQALQRWDALRRLSTRLKNREEEEALIGRVCAKFLELALARKKPKLATEVRRTMRELQVESETNPWVAAAAKAAAATTAAAATKTAIPRVVNTTQPRRGK